MVDIHRPSILVGHTRTRLARVVVPLSEGSLDEQPSRTSPADCGGSTLPQVALSAAMFTGTNDRKFFAMGRAQLYATPDVGRNDRSLLECFSRTLSAIRSYTASCNDKLLSGRLGAVIASLHPSRHFPFLDRYYFVPAQIPAQNVPDAGGAALIDAGKSSRARRQVTFPLFNYCRFRKVENHDPQAACLRAKLALGSRPRRDSAEFSSTAETDPVADFVGPLRRVQQRARLPLRRCKFNFCGQFHLTSIIALKPNV